MPDAAPSRHIARFLLVTFASSLILGVPLLWVGFSATTRFLMDLTPILVASVPAWSMIAGSVGATIRRKVVFSAGLLGFVLTFDLIAFVSGWQAFATGATVLHSWASAVIVTAYQLVLVAGPVVTLLLFAGKRPAVFWES